MGDVQPDPADDALMVALGKKQPLTLTLTKDIRVYRLWKNKNVKVYNVL